MGIAVASGLLLGEPRPAEESQDEASQRHKNGHANTQSDDSGHIGFQPRTVGFFKTKNFSFAILKWGEKFDSKR